MSRLETKNSILIMAYILRPFRPLEADLLYITGELFDRQDIPDFFEYTAKMTIHATMTNRIMMLINGSLDSGNNVTESESNYSNSVPHVKQNRTYSN